MASFYNGQVLAFLGTVRMTATNWLLSRFLDAEQKFDALSSREKASLSSQVSAFAGGANAELQDLPKLNSSAAGNDSSLPDSSPR